jgi:hypothetical protein
MGLEDRRDLMIANWLLDGLMFSGGPMTMSLYQYLSAGAYLMIPLITVGLAAAAAQATRTRLSN